MFLEHTGYQLALYDINFNIGLWYNINFSIIPKEELPTESMSSVAIKYLKTEDRSL